MPRPGQKNIGAIYQIIAEGTYDERVLEVVNDKEFDQNLIMHSVRFQLRLAWYSRFSWQYRLQSEENLYRIKGVIMANEARYPEFALRMAQAADANKNVPLPNHGRLQWIADEMGKMGHSMTMETSRKWFAGETMPRTAAAKLLAHVLSVDPAWLTLGQPSTVGANELKQRNALASGAVNLVVGMIQMDGWNVAFPKRGENGTKAVDFHAIIRGAMYSVNVAVGKRSQSDWEFAVPIDALGNLIIGVCRSSPFNYALVELETETLEEAGRRKGGVIEISIPGDLSGLRRIESFADRL